MRRLWLTVLLAVHASARAADCGDLAVIETRAFQGRLDDASESCVEAWIGEADPSLKVRLSFLLILQAYMAGDQDAYTARMRRHLTEIHTTDPEVAYLYATWLKTHAPEDPAERYRWSKVAFDGRARWIDDRIGYEAIVRSLYDLLVESSLERAVAAERAYAAAPSEPGRLAMDDARRWSRYWLVIAAPCLHGGECGPKFEVEVEGETSCEDLDALESKARAAALPVEEVRCLRARWNRNAKPRVLGLLMTSADRDASGDQWEALRAWHWDATGKEDPWIAARFALSLAAGSGSDVEIGRWLAIALADRNALEAASDRATVTAVLRLAVAVAARSGDSGEEEKALKEWCKAGKDCKP